MPSSHTVRMIDNENGNGKGNGSRSGFTSSSMPALWSPKATSKISSSAATQRIYNACNGTYYFICYVCPLSLSLFASYMPCVLSVSGSSCLPRGLAATAHSRGRAGQAKPSQAKARQARPAGGSSSSDVFGIFLSCVSTTPPTDAKQPPVPSIASY